MAVIIGYLDARLRPRASLLLENGLRILLAHGRPTNPMRIDVLIDTGFNGQLFMGEQTARRVGVILQPLWRNVTVAGGGQPVRIQEGEIDVTWISSPSPRRRASVFVFSPEPPIRRGEPEGLLGMGLISPDKLIIDCLACDVRITT